MEAAPRLAPPDDSILAVSAITLVAAVTEGSKVCPIGNWSEFATDEQTNGLPGGRGHGKRCRIPAG